MNELVAFIDVNETKEDSGGIRYGILTKDENVICLCCLATLPKGDYKIVERNIDTGNTSISDILSEELYDYNAMDDCKGEI